MTRWASVLEMSSYPQKPHKTPNVVMVMQACDASTGQCKEQKWGSQGAPGSQFSSGLS